MEKNYKELLPSITTMVFDVDGVLTNNEVLLLGNGEMARTMSIRDGFALKYGVDQGLNIAVITGARQEPVRDRLKALGVVDVYMGVEDKVSVFREYTHKRDISPEHVLYMGDDIPDLDVMDVVGVSACPNDSVEEVKGISKYVSHKDGGKGCVRDIVQQTLKVQGKWFPHSEL